MPHNEKAGEDGGEMPFFNNLPAVTSSSKICRTYWGRISSRVPTACSSMFQKTGPHLLPGHGAAPDQSGTHRLIFGQLAQRAVPGASEVYTCDRCHRCRPKPQVRFLLSSKFLPFRLSTESPVSRTAGQLLQNPLLQNVHPKPAMPMWWRQGVPATC